MKWLLNKLIYLIDILIHIYIFDFLYNITNINSYMDSRNYKNR